MFFMMKSFKNFPSARNRMLAIGIILLASAGITLATTAMNGFGGFTSPQQAGITVKGVVSDDLGAMAGVNILEKGTTNGAVTNMDGEYTLIVASNATLVVSYIGFTTQEIAVNGRTTIHIRLIEDSQMLDEVVVVGYGAQKKINLTGSVATVGAEQITSRATPNLSASLSGLAPGVRVTQGRGTPGDENVSIQIRGLGSINSSSPMILVDGMVADMTVLNPEDVESINFLKDAASAAIYGSRAANGVVLVTTKKGRREKPRVTFSSLLASEQPVTSLKFMSEMPTWMRLHNTAQRNNMLTSSWYADEVIKAWEAANDNPNGIYTDPVTGNQIPNRIAYPNTDWAQILFQPSLYHQHSISVSGGNDNTTYLLSGLFRENPGTLENTGLQRFNIRANVESKIADFLTIGTQTWATKEFKEPGSTSMTYLFQAYPGINPKYKGLYGAAEDPSMPNMNNVLHSVASAGGMYEYTRLNTTWYVNADIWKGIATEVRFNYNEYQRQDENYSQNLPRYRFREGTETGVESLGVLDNATSYRYSYFSSAYTANLLLRYTRTFRDHELNAFVAYEQYFTKSTGFSATKRGLLDWNVTDITSATNMDSMGGSAKQAMAILSYLGRLNYAYKGKYLFEANFRADGSSRFAPGYRWGQFSAFSAGWRLSEESFFEPLKKYVENLKVKASYGELGNQVSGYYDWQSIYSKTNIVFDESVQSGVIPSQLPNFQMSWEKTATMNLGVEANFLNNRLSLEFDYYTKKTRDMLVRPPQYLTLGTVTTPQVNAATLKNNGIDLNIRWNDRIGKVRYMINANLGYSANEITGYSGELKYELDPNTLDVWGNPTWRYTNIGDVVSMSGNNAIVEGHTYYEYFIRKPYKGTGAYTNPDGTVDPNGGPKDGMIRTKKDLHWVREMIAAKYSFNNNTVGYGAGNLWYGTMLFEDANGDGRYGTADDRVFLDGKSSLPKFIFGLNMSAEWKGIDLSMSWAGRAGSYHYINERGVNSSILSANTDALPYDAQKMFYSYDAIASAENGGNNDYDPANDPNANYLALYPRLLNASSTMVASTFFLYNSSYLKLKSMQIGYTLPKNWVNKVKINNLRLYVTGENLLTVKDKNFRGVDPELGGSINVYPIARMYSGGVSITF